MKGFFTLSLLKGYVENEVLSVEVAASIVLRMLKTYKVAELQELDAQFGNGYKKCPGPSCNAWIKKAFKHGCHHVKCKECKTQFCFRCQNYHEDGRVYFPNMNGCPNKGCKGLCANMNECLCHPCDDCKPGLSCDDCDMPCPSCEVVDVDEDLDFF